MRLEERVCVVTGAASGIGRATAELAAAEGGIVLGLDREPDDSAAYPLLTCDVSDESSVEAAVAEIAARHGRIDALVPCAGVAHEATVPETTLEAWDHVLRVNLTGVFLCAKHAIPLMSPGSSIVVVASMSGVVATDGEAAYCASKAGAIGLARALAADHADSGIRANAVCPGVIDTPLNAGLWQLRGEEFKQELAARHPLGRLGRAEEVAQVIVFLASPESSFVTGAVLLADGGYTAV
jgi:meso-butanediol dehydrogenase / (S,S)-butanediol dehydrogenase / diacetyl reductase